ncbi:hypothetical protein HY772_02825 [Candidatus Woesearchaeota archaeon]|nr:hypothetical protein [Candidatus Woesearchaeota archaeon]
MANNKNPSAPKKSCPKCGSLDVEFNYYLDVVCVLCKTCGYDERDEYDVTQMEKTSAKAKKSFSPYRAGGGARAAKSNPHRL